MDMQGLKALRLCAFDPGTKTPSALKEVGGMCSTLTCNSSPLPSCTSNALVNRWFELRFQSSLIISIMTSSLPNSSSSSRNSITPQIPFIQSEAGRPHPPPQPNALVMTCSGRPPVCHVYNLKHTSPLALHWLVLALHWLKLHCIAL